MNSLKKRWECFEFNDFAKGSEKNNNNKKNEHQIECMAFYYRQYKIKVKSKLKIDMDRLKECEEIYANMEAISNDAIQQMNEYIRLIDEILNALTACSKLIIMNNYFQMTNDKNWWIQHFTRSSYYRKKEQAMKEFLSYVQ